MPTLTAAGWRRGYAADCKAPLVSRQINRFPENRYQDIPRTGGERDNGLSSPEIDTNENPGALTGATGADLHSWLEWVDLNIQRESAARVLMEAVLACDPHDRIPLMERFIDALRPGDPLSPFMGIMASARDWASWASRAELKAYALACYEAMSGRDQAAFLGHIDRRTAA
ncbi:hypothetical protein GIY56_03030 [Paracoccus sp. YIM 132242]|uniref:Uncharacterized protein n=1 Tax=Paracoccus lichenicola TaxID=2665644 RepID=A0A6L6HPM2_9RHOB|nr:hypothetical protein [Paracoccus lichenicola]